MTRQQGRLLTLYSALLWLVMIAVAIVDEIGVL